MGQGASLHPGQWPQPLRSHPPALQWASQGCGPARQPAHRYGGLGLFTLYIAYDTQKMIDEYEMGEDDHLKHAVDLFIDFKVIFTRVLVLLMGRDE